MQAFSYLHDMKSLTIFALLAGLLSLNASAQATIAAEDASKHIGETVTICERVYGGKVVSASNTIILYLGGYYPNQALTVVINGADKGKFKGRPETDDRGKDFIVTGKLVNYQGRPAIFVSSPGRFKPVLIDNNHKPVKKF